MSTGGRKITLTGTDLSNIQNSAKLGAMEAIREQKKDCREEFVSGKECAQSQKECSTRIHKRITRDQDRRKANGRPLHIAPSGRENGLTNRPGDPQDPTVKITFRHFRKNAVKYLLGAIILELILLGISIYAGTPLG